MERSLRVSRSYPQLNRYQRMMYGVGHYLVECQYKNPETQHLSLQFKVTGSSYDIYTINVTNDNHILCDCPDALCECNGAGCYCKHICFVLIKIGQINDPTIFQRKVLTIEEKDKIFKRVQSIAIDRDVVNREVLEAYKKAQEELNIDESYELTDNRFDAKDARNLNEDCSICYNKLDNDKKNEMRCCPSCKNAVHTECVTKWLTINKCCVLCRTEKNWHNVLIIKVQPVSSYINISTYLPRLMNTY